MARLVPAIPMIGAMCPPDRDRRDEPDDESGATRFAPLTANLNKRVTAKIKLGLLGSAATCLGASCLWMVSAVEDFPHGARKLSEPIRLAKHFDLLEDLVFCRGYIAVSGGQQDLDFGLP